MITVGNKSWTIALNRGMSSQRNFGMFESLIALIKTADSSISGLAHFKEPAITRTDLTALIPKS